MGLSDTEGELLFTTNLDTVNHVSFANDKNDTLLKVKMNTLDSFCIKDKNVLLKIDVEGFELQVIQGGEVFFKDHVKSILIEISFMRDISLGEQCVFRIFSLLDKLGYALVNFIDFYPGPKDSPHLRVAQVDCVFINTKFI
jgi:hypothetical protein